MQKTTVSLTESTQRPPTGEEVEAATRILMRAWAPDVRLPGDPEPAYDPDEHDPYDGCNCAGDDEYGSPRGCNCADNCSCDSCDYFRYRRQMTCQAGDVNGVFCTRQTSHRVVVYAMQHNHLSVPRPAGVACPHETGVQADPCHCTAKVVFIQSGLRPVTYWTLTACSVEHAQTMVAKRAEQSDLQYYIERWAYEPHSHDLPPGLAELRTQVRTASSGVQWAVDLSFSGRTSALERQIPVVQRAIAQVVLSALRPLVPADDVWGDDVAPEDSSVSAQSATDGPEPDAADDAHTIGGS
ncbi:hypothetical protein [Streptomyces sp. NPDC005385]|uniref:hypothetical protein n=1 Tax=Streptomyces sp. NPDC005385 TaxID=3157039 RepID=UPI0033A36319